MNRNLKLLRTCILFIVATIITLPLLYARRGGGGGGGRRGGGGGGLRASGRGGGGLRSSGIRLSGGGGLRHGGSRHGRRHGGRYGRWGGGFGIGIGLGGRWPWGYGYDPYYYDDYYYEPRYYTTASYVAPSYYDSQHRLSWRVENNSPYTIEFRAEQGGDLKRIAADSTTSVARGNSFRFTVRADGLPYEVGFIQGKSSDHNIFVEIFENRLRVTTRP